MIQVIFGKNLAEKLRVIEQEKEDLVKSRDKLRDEISSLKAEVRDLQLKRKIEEEDIKHMIKLEREQLELEKQKFQNQQELKTMQEIGKVRAEYAVKIENHLISKNDEANERYSQILERLPNISMELVRKGR